jgi:hypothetical protein
VTPDPLWKREVTPKLEEAEDWLESYLNKFVKNNKGYKLEVIEPDNPVGVLVPLFKYKLTDLSDVDYDESSLEDSYYFYIIDKD